MSLFSQLQKRELVAPPRLSVLGSNLSGHSKLMPYYRPCCGGNEKSVECLVHAGVFNMEFSPDGRFLVAAHEDDSISVLDPLCPQVLRRHTVHESSVNVLKFLSPTSLLTGSDDNTAKQWDFRLMKHPVKIFQGHNDSIKNLEPYHDNQILSGSFDGTIRLWDLHDPDPTPISTVAFEDEDIVRMVLTPDCSKMVVSLRSNVVCLIHNLDIFKDMASVSLCSDVLVDITHMLRLDLMELKFVQNVDSCFVPEQLTCKKNRIEIMWENEDIFTPSVELKDSTQVLTRGRTWYQVNRSSVFDIERECSGLDHFSEKFASDLDRISSEENKADDIRGITVPIEQIKDEPLWPNRYICQWEDSYSASGYIKGPSWSPFAPFVASPYFKGVNIYRIPDNDLPQMHLEPIKMFSSDCSGAHESHPLTSTHTDSVLKCAFSPTHPILASGGLDDKINIYSPKL